ncbi:MAG: hypothetical protein E6Q97_34070 [Desulfurellales bacterium]|nr:MAG: hypothetical protein E6Q97_34070 [Desulfurellales bacterium]
MPSRHRCATCHSYFVRNKKERPEHLYRYGVRVVKPSWCATCGKGEVYAAGECRACRHYRNKHGKRRPRYLWDDSCRCRTCGIPIASLGRDSNGYRRQVNGRCDACAEYKRRTGKARPKHLWGAGPHGWCECGYPAVDLVGKDIPVCERHRE